MLDSALVVAFLGFFSGSSPTRDVVGSTSEDTDWKADERGTSGTARVPLTRLEEDESVGRTGVLIDSFLRPGRSAGKAIALISWEEGSC